jgi:hypothetical protein
VAVSTASPRRVRRRRHGGAVLAAVAYAGAAYAVVAIVQSALDGGQEARPAIAADGLAPVDAAGGRTAADALALQARAARAQQSVYRLEAGNGATGSAFVAWTQGPRTYLLTAQALVARPLAEGERRVFLRRGDRVWGGRVWAVHRESGLAVVWVSGRLAEPLWQRPRRADPLTPGVPAVVLPGGPESPIGEGTVRRMEAKRALVTAPADELAVGAPVVAASGIVAGVVVAATDRTHRVVAIERACARVRACG